MIYAFRTSTYARDIYLYGNRTFTQIPAEYVQPVKQYAADTFTDAQISTALTRGWISESEYAETMALRAV